MLFQTCCIADSFRGALQMRLRPFLPLNMISRPFSTLFTAPDFCLRKEIEAEY